VKEVDEMSVNKLTANELTVNELTVDELTVDELTQSRLTNESTVEKTYLLKLSVYSNAATSVAALKNEAQSHGLACRVLNSDVSSQLFHVSCCQGPML
jgi:hypothetical protein